MFLLAQFIGLYVISAYTPIEQTIVNPATGETENITINPLPAIFQTPEPETERDFFYYFIQIVPAFIIAIFLILILTKYKLKFILKLWFFLVVVMALYLAINAFTKNLPLNSYYVIAILALILGFLKIYKPTIILHNLTELLIYPGIAAIFVPILNKYTIIILLILISIYDMWAVWRSGIMQKMAKFQIKELNIFGGFFIPYLSKKLRAKIKKLRKSKKRKKVKIQLAILGGGDVVFPIITAGVFLRAFGLVSALFVVFGAFAGLLYILISSEKKKPYPAMPFITAGIFIALALWWLIFYMI